MTHPFLTPGLFVITHDTPLSYSGLVCCFHCNNGSVFHVVINNVYIYIYFYTVTRPIGGRKRGGGLRARALQNFRIVGSAPPPVKNYSRCGRWVWYTLAHVLTCQSCHVETDKARVFLGIKHY